MRLTATPHNTASGLALAVYAKVLDAVRGDVLVHQAVQRAGDTLFVQGRHVDLAYYDRIWIAGVGKASISMAKAAAEIVGDRLAGGLIIAKRGSAEVIPGVTVLEASHPVPDQSSLDAGMRMLDFAESLLERDFVLFLLSGGASALMDSLLETINLGDLRETNELMLASGADIRTMNAVRSRLSRIKAGGLGRAFEPATVIALVLSDVVNNDLHTIGSAPLLSGRAAGVHVPREMTDRFPAPVRHALEAPMRAAPISPPIDHFVIGSISLAIHAAVDAARAVGLKPFPFGDAMKGEARIMTAKICTGAREWVLQDACMVFGGETTVKIRGKGLGGRCQEMALAAARSIAEMPDTCFLACGTDGADGPTDAAGGIVDPGSIERARQAGFHRGKSLAANDSYHYLQACDGLVITGPTGSNVNDIALVVQAA